MWHRLPNILEPQTVGQKLLNGLPWWLSGKESTCNAGDLGSISGSGRTPGEGTGNPLQYSGLENLHEQRSLVGYSPWGQRVRHDSVTKHAHILETDQSTQSLHILGSRVPNSSWTPHSRIQIPKELRYLTPGTLSLSQPRSITMPPAEKVTV